MVDLDRDTEGNTLGIAAATVLLLISLTGSGTDMARAYMTKTSLQNACDAGVLAGRKAMATTGTYSPVESAKAKKMFDFNFNWRATNSKDVVFNTAATEQGAVTGTASTTMPTVIMGIFGFKTIPLTVECSAELQLASADVMFVLDTTGSMACEPNGQNCNNGANSRMVGLRQAIRDFYSSVAGAVTNKSTTRIRFGFVPYSSTVNLRDLVTSGAMPISYFNDRLYAQQALATFTTAVNVPTVGSPVNSTETFRSAITSAQCTDYGNNRYPVNGGNPVSGGGPAPAATTRTTYSTGSWKQDPNSALGICIRNVSTTTTTYEQRRKFSHWTFQGRWLDVKAFMGMGNVPVVANIDPNATVPNQGTYTMTALAAMNGTPGVTGLTTINTAWDGCIEERDTVEDYEMSPVPSGATDLNIDMVPRNEETRWKLYLPDVQWYRGTTTATSRYATKLENWSYRQPSLCPSASSKLFTEVDTTNPAEVPEWLETYINSLTPNGNTYHDVGMIWGARLGSPSGLFQANVNADSTQYSSISRHIIFMTDGEMWPEPTNYSAYGTERYAARVAPSGVDRDTLRRYHNNRFGAACALAKNLGYTVWVIGFGQALTPEMRSCATADRAYFAADSAELNKTFRFIASQVSDLRINK